MHPNPVHKNIYSITVVRELVLDPWALLMKREKCYGGPLSCSRLTDSVDADDDGFEETLLEEDELMRVRLSHLHAVSPYDGWELFVVFGFCWRGLFLCFCLGVVVCWLVCWELVVCCFVLVGGWWFAVSRSCWS